MVQGYGGSGFISAVSTDAPHDSSRAGRCPAVPWRVTADDGVGALKLIADFCDGNSGSF
jgi:hypothetical protein